MVLNSKETQKLFEIEYSQFISNFELLSNHANLNPSNFDEIIPRELRLFKIRLQLVIGLQINFDPKYAMVKNQQTTDAYIQIMKSNEAWFAYESMKKFVERINWKNEASKTPIDLFNANQISSLGIQQILDFCNNQLNAKSSKAPSFSNDIEDYLEFLHHNLSPRARTLKNAILETKTSFKNAPITLNHIQIFSILYATRNIFVHKGETAKSGVKYYKNKIDLLKVLYDFIILFLLKVMNVAIQNQNTNFNKNSFH